MNGLLAKSGLALLVVAVGAFGVAMIYVAGQGGERS